MDKKPETVKKEASCPENDPFSVNYLLRQKINSLSETTDNQITLDTLCTELMVINKFFLSTQKQHH